MKRHAAATFPSLSLTAVALASLAVVSSLPARGGAVIAMSLAAFAAVGLSLCGRLSYRSAAFGCVALALFATLSRPATLGASEAGPASLVILLIIATAVCRSFAQLEARSATSPGGWANSLQSRSPHRPAEALRRAG